MNSRRDNSNDIFPSVIERVLFQGYASSTITQKPVYATKRSIPWSHRSGKLAAFDDMYWKILMKNYHSHTGNVHQKTPLDSLFRADNPQMMKSSRNIALNAMVNRLVGKRSIVYYLFNEFFKEKSKPTQSVNTRPSMYKSDLRMSLPLSPLDSIASGLLR